jgi:hypothetical protein
LKKIKLSFLIITAVIFLSAGSLEISAQSSGTLRGFVTDSTSGEILAYSNIFIKIINKGTASDTRGFFSLPSIPEGEYKVLVSYIGYFSKEIDVVILSNKITEINIELSPSKIGLQDIIKIGEEIKRSNETDISLYTLSGKEMDLIPKGVESDLFRTLQIIPGVQASNDVSSRYYVRGGGSDQNLVIINGATIYNPYHALGIFSIVDPEIINNVQFYKGGFPAEYGGRLSSVMNIRTNDGNKNRFSASANASFLTGKGSIEGPIPNGSFMITGRKSYFGKFLKNFLNNKEAPFDFYDLSLKLNYSNPEMLKNSKFTFHTLLSKDDIKYGDPNKEDFSFQNNIFGIDYYQVWEKPLFSVVSFSVSEYRAEVVANESEAKPRSNDISEFSWNNHFTYLFDSRDELGVGLNLKTFQSVFNYENLQGAKSSYDDFGANFDLYSKYKFLRFENIGIEAGLRISPVSLTKQTGAVLLPRLNFTYRPFESFAFKGAWGLFKQEIIAYTDDSEVVSIFEPYLIIPDYLSPSTAIHYMGGVEYTPISNLSIQIEGYYKIMHSLVDLNPDKISYDDPDLLSADGESYGAEFMLKYQQERFYSTLSYTLSWAFKNLDGERYLPKYDSRHNISAMAGVDLGAGWKINAMWMFNSGRPFTQNAGYYDKLYIQNYWNQWLTSDSYKPYTLLGGKNAARLPYYHRLDMNISKQFNLFFMNVTLDVNMLNIYNRNNLFYFDRDTGERINMLPFLPTASLRVEI